MSGSLKEASGLIQRRRPAVNNPIGYRGLRVLTRASG